MTEKLYDIEPYLTQFTATVLSCTAEGDHFRVILDRTAFFPCEGGQGADHGTLGTVQVLDVLLSRDALVHITAAPLTVGEVVCGQIDAARRHRMMQTHTAEHILSGVCRTLYGTTNVGFHLGDSEVTLDLDLPLTEQEVTVAEAAANRAIWENRPVRALYPKPEELAGLDYRSKLDLTDGVRLVVSNGIQAIREKGFGRENIPAMMAAAVVISLPLIILFIVFRKKIIEGVARGGTKG